MSPQAIMLAISVARGLIKFGRRLELLSMEKTAQEEMLMLRPSVVRRPVSRNDVIDGLRELVAQSKGAYDALLEPLVMHIGLEESSGDATHEPDGQPVLDADLQEINALLARGVPAGPDTARAYELFGNYFPDRAKAETLSPDREFLDRMRKLKPDLDWDNPDLQATVFSVSAGSRDGQISHAGRIGLLVADVLAEFGAETAGLLINHQPTGQLVSGLLARFAEPDLEDFEQRKPLLEHSLRATLAGVIEHRGAIERNNKWVTAALDAVSQTQNQVGGDFALELISGKAFPALLGSLLTEVSGELDDDEANEWSRVSANLLSETGRLLKTRGDFDDFFKEHWGDMLGATAVAMQKHGVKIFRGDRPLAHQVAYDVMNHISANSGAMELDRETLVSLVDVAITTAAANPTRVTKGIEQDWLKVLVQDVLTTISKQNIEESVSKRCVRKIVGNALTTFSQHSELLIEKQGIVRELVGGILASVGKLDTFKADKLADAAATSALLAVSQNPQLLKTNFAPIVSTFTRYLAELVAHQQLSTIESEQIAGKAIVAIAENPAVFESYDRTVAPLVLRTFLVLAQAQGSSTTLPFGGQVRADIVGNLLNVVARKGKRILASHGTREQLETAMTSIISVGLQKAQAELGQDVSISEVAALMHDVAVMFADSQPVGSENRRAA